MTLETFLLTFILTYHIICLQQLKLLMTGRIAAKKADAKDTWAEMTV